MGRGPGQAHLAELEGRGRAVPERRGNQEQEGQGEAPHQDASGKEIAVHSL